MCTSWLLRTQTSHHWQTIAATSELPTPHLPNPRELFTSPENSLSPFLSHSMPAAVHSAQSKATGADNMAVLKVAYKDRASWNPCSHSLHPLSSANCLSRYLLHLSGVTYSTRLKYLLLCGSAVIFPHKREHEHVEFWQHLVKDRHNIVLTGVQPLLDIHSGYSEPLFRGSHITLLQLLLEPCREEVANLLQRQVQMSAERASSCSRPMYHSNVAVPDLWFAVCLPSESISWQNSGEPMLAAVRELQANQTWAQEVAAAGRHLATEVLHPDNVARSEHLAITEPVPAAQHLQAPLTVHQSSQIHRTHMR